jgi:segregation and condensation protein A
VRVHRTSEYADNLYDLLKAYADRRQRQAVTRIQFKRLPVWTIKEAREQLERLIGVSTDWGSIDQYLIEYLVEPIMRTTILASTFSATLEMAREGRLEIRQTEVFAPIFVRRKPVAAGQAGSTPQ